MIYRKFIRIRLLVTAVCIGMLFIGILLNVMTFEKLVSQNEPVWYIRDFLGREILNEDAVMPSIGNLIREAGFLPLLGFAVLLACIIPVFFILNDYHTVKSIRTIMRLPAHKTLYYFDKLLPPVILLSLYWFMQFLSLLVAANIYLRVFPEEIRPTHIKTLMWNEFPQSILDPFTNASHVPAMISFLILIPATVILFILSTKSGRRGILSGIIACAGVFAAILYFMELPASVWLTPIMTVTVIFTGILHINKIPIV